MHKPVQWDEARASEIVASLTSLDGATLPILHALQEEFGCIPDEAIPFVASALNISRADVHGIVTFYHDFRREPAGRHVLKLCRAESCQAMGGARMAEDFLARLGIGWGGTTTDGSLTVDGVYCLGLCVASPACLYDGEPAGRLDPATLDAMAEEARGA
jgi:formate dehydrogenase subunit gamma